MQAGLVGKYVADECVKLMGGLGLTKTGQGARIEAIYRGIPSLIVPGKRLTHFERNMLIFSRWLRGCIVGSWGTRGF